MWLALATLLLFVGQDKIELTPTIKAGANYNLGYTKASLGGNLDANLIFKRQEFIAGFGFDKAAKLETNDGYLLRTYGIYRVYLKNKREGLFAQTGVILGRQSTSEWNKMAVHPMAGAGFKFKRLEISGDVLKDITTFNRSTWYKTTITGLSNIKPNLDLIIRQSVLYGRFILEDQKTRSGLSWSFEVGLRFSFIKKGKT